MDSEELLKRSELEALSMVTSLSEAPPLDAKDNEEIVANIVRLNQYIDITAETIRQAVENHYGYFAIRQIMEALLNSEEAKTRYKEVIATIESKRSALWGYNAHWTPGDAVLRPVFRRDVAVLMDCLDLWEKQEAEREFSGDSPESRVSKLLMNHAEGLGFTPADADGESAGVALVQESDSPFIMEAMKAAGIEPKVVRLSDILDGTDTVGNCDDNEICDHEECNEIRMAFSRTIPDWILDKAIEQGRDKLMHLRHLRATNIEGEGNLENTEKTMALLEAEQARRRAER